MTDLMARLRDIEELHRRSFWLYLPYRLLALGAALALLVLLVLLVMR